jgi:hypothetical protein
LEDACLDPVDFRVVGLVVRTVGAHCVRTLTRRTITRQRDFAFYAVLRFSTQSRTFGGFKFANSDGKIS